MTQKRFRLSSRFSISLTPRQPSITIKDLALMLEIDLHLGRKTDFQKRVHKAISAAYQKGLQDTRYLANNDAKTSG